MRTPPTLPIPLGYAILPAGTITKPGDLVYGRFSKRFNPVISIGEPSLDFLCYIRPFPRQPGPITVTLLTERLDNYFGNGGLFNPEHMDHDAVRNLLFDCRAFLNRLEQIL
jgi:hypothetical protein